MHYRAQHPRMNTATRPRRRLTRRGVVSVLAMMILVLFGSLSVAMAIASQGNLRTASTHLHVLRAMGAAETGIQVAENRLLHVVSRFIVEKGEVDAGFADALWDGSFGAGFGQIDILTLNNGFAPTGVR